MQSGASMVGSPWAQKPAHCETTETTGIYSMCYKSHHSMRGKASQLHLLLHQSFCMYSVHHRLWGREQWTSYLALLLLWVLKTEEWAGGRWGRQRRAHCNGKHRLQWEKTKTTYCLIGLKKSNSMAQSISHLSLWFTLSTFDHLFKQFFSQVFKFMLKINFRIKD